MLLTIFSNHEKPLKNSPWSNHWFIHLLWHRRSASWCPWAPGKSQDFAKMWGKRRGNDGKMLGKWLGKWVESCCEMMQWCNFHAFHDTWNMAKNYWDWLVTNGGQNMRKNHQNSRKPGFQAILGTELTGFPTLWSNQSGEDRHRQQKTWHLNMFQQAVG